MGCVFRRRVRSPGTGPSCCADRRAPGQHRSVSLAARPRRSQPHRRWAPRRPISVSRCTLAARPLAARRGLLATRRRAASRHNAIIIGLPAYPTGPCITPKRPVTNIRSVSPQSDRPPTPWLRKIGKAKDRHPDRVVPTGYRAPDAVGLTADVFTSGGAGPIFRRAFFPARRPWQKSRRDSAGAIIPHYPAPSTRRPDRHGVQRLL